MTYQTNRTVTPYYESIEFAVTTATTDYNVDTQQVTFKAVLNGSTNPLPRFISLRTDQTITVKFNSTSNHAITVASTDSPFELEVEMTNVFISNASGSTANVKMFLH